MREADVSRDVTCPVCLGVRAEPVTLPCGHGVCLTCFEQSLHLANKECPLCRLRISSWARRAAREGTLVDEALRARIRRHLSQPEEPADSVDPPVAAVNHRLCLPGEIRLEFEEQARLEAERLERERREQLLAGEALALALAAEERRAWQETQERILREDQELARCLSSGVDESRASREVALQVEADLRLARQLQQTELPTRSYALRPRGKGPACV
ncbi:E3 ubiquitin-protein ligase rnf168 isoform X2 [Ixodes scapularis]|nr:E3 ubiquitin-protein ligase rnf168 isoform X2 [Ixodes scapularis]XP_029850983.2 E3 ubiquitin-protein ligase rnf168 isoform X2 [Ixodes scapularis]